MGTLSIKRQPPLQARIYSCRYQTTENKTGKMQAKLSQRRDSGKKLGEAREGMFEMIPIRIMDPFHLLGFPRTDTDCAHFLDSLVLKYKPPEVLELPNLIHSSLPKHKQHKPAIGLISSQYRKHDHGKP